MPYELKKKREKQILLVVDDLNERKGLQQQLESNGFKVIAAHNGLQALMLFPKHVFDLVITDIFMPDCDGLEIIRTILSMDPASKIIAVSEKGETVGRHYLSTAKLMGATCCFTKPLKLQEFLNKLNEILQKKAEKAIDFA